MDARQGHLHGTATHGRAGRHPGTGLGWWPGALAAVAVVAVVIGTVGPGGETSGPPVVVPTPTSVTTSATPGDTVFLWDPDSGDVRTVFSASGRIKDAELAPDGRRLVYERRVNDSWQIYLLEPDRPERRLTSGLEAATDPTWHPNGRAIAFAGITREGSDADIFALGVDDGSVARIAGTPGDDSHPDWSPDGERVVFDSRSDDPGGEIWVTTIEGQRRLAPRDPLDGAIEPAWSPDGRWIAFVGYRRRGTASGSLIAPTVRRMRPNGSHIHTIGSGAHYRYVQEPSWSPDGRSLVIESPSGLLLLDLATRRNHLVRVHDSDSEPSWHAPGILMTPLSASDVPAPVPAPSRFHVQAAATVTLHRGRGCELEVEGPIRPGVLMIELVNDSSLDGYFRILRLDRPRPRPQVPPGRPWGAAASFSEVHAHPTSYFYGRGTVYVGRSGSTLWSSQTWISSGAWAIVCSEDRIQEPHGFSVAPVGVAGPIEVRR